MGVDLRIVTDCVADIPRALARRLRIEMVPIYLVVGEQSYRDDGTLDRQWFYDRLTERPLPKTAAPPPQEFLDAYHRLVDEGAEYILGLFAASSVSSIYDHARIAARQLTDVPVKVVDTGQVTMGLGWMAVLAAETAAAGAAPEEVRALILELRHRTRVLGVLDDMDHLRHSGRVGWAKAFVADLLQVKPLVSFEQGAADLIGRVRTHVRARRRLVDRVSWAAPLERLAILHSRVDAAVLSRFQDALAPYAPERPIPVVEVGSVFAAHVGPGCLGVAYVQLPA